MSGRGALAFLVANVLAGVLNYLFQVHAAAVLDAASFGSLSAWFARVTIFTTVATVVQFLSLDFPVPERPFFTLLRSCGALALISLAAVGALSAGSRTLDLRFLGGVVVIGNVLFFAVVGQLQARLQLGVVALSLLAAAVTRCALPFAWTKAARGPGFYVAHAVSALVGILVILAVVRRAPPPAALRGRDDGSSLRLRLGRPLLLALAAVIFPSLDVLAVSATTDATTTGNYSRMALAARIVFFGGASVLQTLLPYQLHAGDPRMPAPAFVRLAERWLTPAVLTGALAFAGIVDRALLHPRGDEAVWLYASCLGTAVLVAVLAYVQRFAVDARLEWSVACLSAVVVACAGTAALVVLGQHNVVTRYTVAVLAAYMVVLLGAAFVHKRSHAHQPEVTCRR